MAKLILVSGQITESRGVFEGESQRLGGFVEAENLQARRNIDHRAKDGEWVGSRAEANVPNDKLCRMIFQAVAKLELADVERFCFRLWSDHRVKRLAVCQRVY